MIFSIGDNIWYEPEPGVRFAGMILDRCETTDGYEIMLVRDYAVLTNDTSTPQWVLGVYLFARDEESFIHAHDAEDFQEELQERGRPTQKAQPTCLSLPATKGDRPELIKITHATIIREHGPDIVTLYTDLPRGIWPFNGYQLLRMEIARGQGPEYLEKHFPGVTYKLINDR